MKKCHFIALLLGIFQAGAAFAGNVTYFIDPSRSFLTLTGTWGSVTIIPSIAGSPPDTGSLTTSYTGVITANRDTILNTFRITGGTVSARDTETDLDAQFSPFLSPANYAFSAQTADQVLFALRDFSFSPTSGIASSTMNFDVSQFFASIISGRVDYADIISSFSSPLPGPPLFLETDGTTPLDGTLPFASTVVSLDDTDGTETLTLPIETNFNINVDGSLLKIQLSGSIVAVTPEPASLAILGSVAVVLFRRRAAR